MVAVSSSSWFKVPQAAAGASIAAACLASIVSSINAEKKQKDIPATSTTISRTFCEGSDHRGGNLLRGVTERFYRNKNAEKNTQIDNGGERDTADSFYPNFSRHGKQSLLPQYLTKEVYRDLCQKRTKNGVTLEDMIRAGVSLPWGAHPPRGVAGVYAGDAESYRTFAALLSPLIEKHHMASLRKGRLQRHRTDLSPGKLLQQKLDLDGDYILSTRLRLARSLSGFRFAPCIDRAERRQVEALVSDSVKDWKMGKYISVREMKNAQHDDLIRRRILFPDPDDFALSAGLGRDWPDSRGVYCENWKDTPSLMIWCNFEDHVWIISDAKGGDVQSVFTRLSQATWALETALEERGHAFAEDQRLGFLNTSPANVGTGLKASVCMKLVLLGQQPGFYELISRLRLMARAETPQTDQLYTGIFHIANAESLGKSEVDLINVMIEGVSRLVDLEKQLERGKEVDLDAIAQPHKWTHF